MDLGIRRPVFGKSWDLENDPFHSNGTCFFVTYKGFFFVLTAGHVLTKAGQRMFDARLSLGQSTGLFVEFDIAGFDRVDPNCINEEEVAAALDFSWGRCRPSITRAQEFNGVKLFDLDYAMEELSEVNDTVVKIAGFATNGGKDQLIDYENATFDFTLHYLLGRVMGLSELNGCISLAVFESTSTTYDGLSGSPAFIEKDGLERLLGLVIRGSADAKIIHLVSITVIRQLLDAVLNEKPNEVHDDYTEYYSVELKLPGEVLQA